MYRRLRTALCACTGAALLLPAAAPAKIIEVGTTTAKSPPSCPATPCQAVSRTTAYQVKVGPDRDSFLVPADGRIVAWTISLGAPTKKQIAYFEDRFSGPSTAGISILRKIRRLNNRTLRASPQQPLMPYFGHTVQFPLFTSLKVRAGDKVALTVPTWAPALALGFGTDTVWRASRSTRKCADYVTQTAQLVPGAATEWRCLYQTARVTFSATLVTAPAPPKPPAKPKTKP